MGNRSAASGAIARFRAVACCAVGLCFLAALPPAAAEGPGAPAPQPLSFELTLDPKLQSEPYTGRVYVVLAKGERREPRAQMGDWFRPPQIFALDVRDAVSGSGILLGNSSIGFPSTMAELPVGEYSVQAIVRRSKDHPVPGRGAGDLYSEARTVHLDPTTSGVQSFRLDHEVGPARFNETERVRLFEMKSELLSAFHGREMKLRAGVVLPRDWAEGGDRRYPVLYVIGGFGSDHRMARWIAIDPRNAELTGAVLHVVPDSSCYYGHCGWVDSETNGPWGRALVEELIPAVEAKFRGQGNGRNRYVTGVSSGGWSSIWLQVNYPDQFNGCWAHCPDPVDFRDFQRVDLYRPGSNMFVDEAGARRPLARDDGKVLLYYDDFVHREDVLGPGGQIRCFEAMFSPRGGDGAPRAVFDRRTGAVDVDVAKRWERFDIRLVLERRWNELKGSLAGKLHIYAGEKDTFYLDGAVRLLKESLSALGSDAEVRIIDGMAHGMYDDATEPMYRTITAAAGGHPEPP